VAEKRWQPGDIILNETCTGGTNHLILVFPAIVIEDTSEYLALYHPIDHTFTCSYEDSDIAWPRGSREATPIDEQIGFFLAWQPERFREFVSKWHVVYLEPHGAMHGVKLFWDSSWNLTNWYVNLQAPYVRTQAGIRIEDHYLDLEVDPDLRWRWKDSEQFDAFCRAGVYDDGLARAIRAEGERMARRIEARAWPFNAGWPDWRPDPAWPMPHIRDHWAKGSYPFELSI
jgi:hypothetical protein